MAAISKYFTAKNCTVAGATIVALYLLKRKRHADKINGVKRSSELQLSKDEAKKERTVVDKVFFARILKIVKIMVPGVFCKESGYCLLIAAMLVARTYCDVWMIQNGTMIERHQAPATYNN